MAGCRLAIFALCLCTVLADTTESGVRDLVTSETKFGDYASTSADVPQRKPFFINDPSAPSLYPTSVESMESAPKSSEDIPMKVDLSVNEGEMEVRTEEILDDPDLDNSSPGEETVLRTSENVFKPPLDVQLPHLLQHPESARILKHNTATPHSAESGEDNVISSTVAPRPRDDNIRELHFAPDSSNSVQDEQNRKTTITDAVEVESGKMINLLPEVGTEDEHSFYTVPTTTTTEAPSTLESLRTFLEDIYLRGPIAILVDVDQDNLAKTRDMWNSMEAIDGILKLTDVLLVGYDNEGITWMSHHRGTGSQRLEYESKSFRKALYGLMSSSKDPRPGDPEPVLARTVRLLPYDSAIFLFCSDDSEYEQDMMVEESTFAARLQKMLLAKRMKLYTVSDSKKWSGISRASGGAALAIPMTEREEHQRDLRALTVYYDSSEEDELEFDEQQTVVLKSGLFQDQSLAIPVDSTIKVMTIIITNKPQLAMLYGPKGIRIDLLDVTSVRNFSFGSDIIVQDQKLAVRLSMNQEPISEKRDMIMEQDDDYQGIWRLTVRNDDAITPYEVEVKAETTVRVMAKITPYYAYDRVGGSKIKIAVGGTVASVREAIVVDRQGQKVARLPYRYREGSSTESDTTDIESLRAMESGTLVKEVPVPKELPTGLPFYIQITGRNEKDEQFVRVTQEIRVLNFDPDVEELTTEMPITMPIPGKSNKTHEHQVMMMADTPQVLGRGIGDIEAERGINSNMSRQIQLTNIDGAIPLTSIQIGASSKLYGAPGAQMQIHFEVTNHRDNAVYYRFGAKDDQYYLRTMAPLRQWINAGQTANVVLTVGITSTAENNMRDMIAFTASGLEQVTLNAYVYVETDGRISSDRSRPSLRHDFRGDCMGYLGSDSCNSKTWGLDITARDTDSGVMRISAASSSGIMTYYPGFYAGTREEARARYTSSCCHPTVTISSTDVSGNIASYELNVSLDLEDIDNVNAKDENGLGEWPETPTEQPPFSGSSEANQYFTPAAIAAISLGILLFIALVIVIVLIIRACLKKRRESRDLPSYTTQRPTRTP